ncbi:hypothetical protein IWW36_001149 [Coemansia brasiliensis]|uniref:Uncharacterized protein n=1 Tax=Coemansia brasiliensis TaxID=2650707 RepID=A0A9W8M0N2_9FUNG|nr:hypothetical protein IWW36_001149 [Coemansia brasiliensis]
MALYSKQDLKESQELYQDCEFISKKTRSIYAWRAALWVRYCKEHGLDFTVTEDKLINYLDWLFEIDLVNKINTKKNYVPDILRDHMGSVICLWRIQTGNNPDLVSPKEGTRYQAKWDEILRNYPRRERFQGRPHTHDSHLMDHRAGPSGMAASPHISNSGHHGNYGDGVYPPHPVRYHPSPNHHYHLQSWAQGPSMMPSHPPSVAPPYHQSHNFSRPSAIPPPVQMQFPVGITDKAELTWQLRWAQDLNWREAATRFVFTTAMSIWVDAADVISLRLGDIYFASSTMAPRLPASVLRIALSTISNTSARSSTASVSNTGAATSRQQFSIIRARNPLLCPWNALGTMLFYHWHISNSPPPTFADNAWQNSLVLPMQSSDAVEFPPTASGAGGFISPQMRTSLVRDLLPLHKLPVESIDERRTTSRFLDFILDLRIVILQDAAILRCCNEQLPQGFDVTSILSHPVFSSLEFAQFCETMQNNAADEIRILQYDLDTALYQPGRYDADRPMYIDGHNAGHAANEMPLLRQIPKTQSPLNPNSNNAIMNSPEGIPFSPVVSPSPPMPQPGDSSDASHFMDIGPKSESNVRRTPTSTPQQSVSHSLPARTPENWNDSRFGSNERAMSMSSMMPAASTSIGVSASTSGGNPMYSLPKRRHLGASAVSGSSSIVPSAPHHGSPYSMTSPKTYWRSHHMHRASRSPSRMMRSPAMSSRGLGPDKSMLPPIAQISQPPSVAGSPMQIDATSMDKNSDEGRQSTIHQQHETDPLIAKSDLRRSSDSTVDNSGDSHMSETREEITLAEIEQINRLRRENAQLRERMQHLEVTVAQKQAEVHEWMTRIENNISHARK